VYRKKSVREREGVLFQRKVDSAKNVIQDFEPLQNTLTHVLIDNWYVRKRIWKAVKARQWDLTSGLKKNHKLGRTDVESQAIWVDMSDFAAELPKEAFQLVLWPNQKGGQMINAFLIRTRVKKLCACQVLIAKTSADDQR
jgi:hypothetical protein